ncbi:tRNA adenosine(34) deaminase TadA [Arthrobacter agilis]|uniref:tRNA adenosine(34) deaminase TadA n=1 Tax=Arthrobacter agilis TaxID=37921 RepID=UPI002366C095|nr:tRNA adenosine(34) deaminase TadA [Arthrobacter agilis]WDF33727.1 tRNA adenosine(34) deaminase TadA [Arthrobacter agilis]
MPSSPPPEPAGPAEHRALMGLALEAARRAQAGADVPIGAVVVGPDGTVLSVGWNQREELGDPTAHAEVQAIRAAAAATGAWRLEGCTLVVTLEPCAMCAGASVLARIPRVVFGAWDEKAGASGSVFDVLRERRLNHWTEVFSGVREEECARLLKEFFVTQRTREANTA